MKKWSIEMWLGMAALAFAMFGPPIVFWIKVAFTPQVLESLIIAALVLLVVSRFKQYSSCLFYYACFLGAIMVGIALSGAMVVASVCFGLFFIVFGAIWSVEDEPKAEQEESNQTKGI